MSARFDPPTRRYEAFIFDCDGTLADSMPLHHRVWRRVLERHGATFDFSWQLFMSRAGKTIELTVIELNQQFGLHMDPKAVSAEHFAEYQAAMAELEPIEPVVSFARAQAAAGGCLAVASGGELHTVQRTLSIIGVSALFPIVVTAADVKHGKPAPDLFLLAAERMRVAPAECVVFEDSALGIEAAERAGMGAVLVVSDV